MAKPGVVCNLIVTGNNKNKSFFSELIINENQSFLSGQFREDDTKLNVKQTNQRNNLGK